MSIQEEFRKKIQTLGSDWMNIQTVRLGKLDGETVRSEIDGVLWARQWNGKEIKVNNRALVSADYDLRVLVGVQRTQPGKWFILQSMEDYLTPAGGGRIAYHAAQHMFDAPDEVPIDRKQITVMTVRKVLGSTFSVQIYGGVVRTGNTHITIEPQIFDMSPYVSTAGAVYVNLEADEDGIVGAHSGEPFGSIELSNDASYIPVPEEGNIYIASILMYEGQSEIVNTDILVAFPIERGGMGAQIFSAQERTHIQEGDYLGFYSTHEGRLRKISLARFKSSFLAYVDQLYGLLKTSFLSPGTAAGGDLTGTYPNPTVAKIRGYAVDPTLTPADGDTLVWNNVTSQYESEAGGGGGGGTPITYDDLTVQIDGSTDHFDLAGTASGAVMLFYNTTFQSTDTFVMDVGDAGFTLDFIPMVGDILIAIYGTSGVLTESEASPAVRVYMNQNFR